MPLKNVCRRRRRVVQTLAGFSLVATWVREVAHASESDQASLIELISNFSRLRGIAYNEVRDLRAMHKGSKPKLAKSQQLYGRAKTAADTWMDSVRLSLVTNGRLDTAALTSQAAELRVQTSALVDFAQASRAISSPGEKQRNPVVIAVIVALLVPLTDAAIKVFEAWGRNDEKQRSQIRAEMDRLRWANFEEIV